MVAHGAPVRGAWVEGRTRFAQWLGQPPAPLLRKPYDWYSFGFMPLMGKLVAGDAESYRYLAESIRMHPDQATLKAMMQQAGFGHVDVHSLAGGIVALHVGIKC